MKRIVLAFVVVALTVLMATPALAAENGNGNLAAAANLAEQANNAAIYQGGDNNAAATLQANVALQQAAAANFGDPTNVVAVLVGEESNDGTYATNDEGNSSDGNNGGDNAAVALNALSQANYAAISQEGSYNEAAILQANVALQQAAATNYGDPTNAFLVALPGF